MSSDSNADSANAHMQQAASRAMRGPSMITFYIPPSQPIGLPDGTTMTFHRSERIPWLAGNVRRVATGFIDPTSTDKNFVSFMFRRSVEISSSSIELMGRAARIFDDVTDSDGMMTEATDALQTSVGSTVVEATTPLIAPISESFNEAIADALERMFEEFGNVIVGHRVAVGDLAVDQMTRLNCVPFVPYIIRTGDFAGNQSFRGGIRGLYSVNDGESLREEHFREIEEDGTILKIDHLVRRAKLGDPLVASLHHLFRARRSFYLEGDFQSTVVSAFTSIEIYLNSVLYLLQWERNGSREEAETWFQEGFVTRLRKYYHPLLGGNWNDKDSRTIPGMIATTAKVRGRVVHAGHEPTEDEVRNVLAVTEEIMEQVKRLLTMRSHQYPRTSTLVIGRHELQELGAWTGTVRDFGEQEGFDVLFELDSYLSWLNGT